MDFPAVTICSSGMSLDNLEAGFYKFLFAYLAAHNVTVAVSPYNASTLLAKVSISSMFLLTAFTLTYTYTYPRASPRVCVSVCVNSGGCVTFR